MATRTRYKQRFTEMLAMLIEGPRTVDEITHMLGPHPGAGNWVRSWLKALKKQGLADVVGSRKNVGCVRGTHAFLWGWTAGKPKPGLVAHKEDDHEPTERVGLQQPTP